MFLILVDASVDISVDVFVDVFVDAPVNASVNDSVAVDDDDDESLVDNDSLVGKEFVVTVVDGSDGKEFMDDDKVKKVSYDEL
tara:strand:- start:9 stop:257 length:249 start_codon:yes stop_codon:yes gene_type:complete